MMNLKVGKVKVQSIDNDEVPVEIGFKFGGELVEPSNPESLAKTRLYSKRTIYFVKVVNSGGDAGHFANPVSLSHNNSDFKSIDRYGRNKYDYKVVSKKVFDLYVKFLETRNKAWLKNAESLMMSR